MTITVLLIYSFVFVERNSTIESLLRKQVKIWAYLTSFEISIYGIYCTLEPVFGVWKQNCLLLFSVLLNRKIQQNLEWNVFLVKLSKGHFGRNLRLDNQSQRSRSIYIPWFVWDTYVLLLVKGYWDCKLFLSINLEHVLNFHLLPHLDRFLNRPSLLWIRCKFGNVHEKITSFRSFES